MFWFWLYLGIYLAVALAVAVVMGVLEVRRAKANGLFAVGCDCTFDMCIGLLWPVAALIYIAGNVILLFPKMCIWISDAIDRFVAKEGKKRLEKSEPRDGK